MKSMTQLKRFRGISLLVMLIALFIGCNIIANHISIWMVIVGITFFVVGIEWLTLLITDPESKNISIIRNGSIIEFAKIIIYEESFKKDKESVKKE